jgi:hypothetical protein
MDGRCGPFVPRVLWLQADVARHNANTGRRLRYE